jgi:hypothetical protein
MLNNQENSKVSRVQQFIKENTAKAIKPCKNASLGTLCNNKR